LWHARRERENDFRVFVGKLEGKKLLEILDTDGSVWRSKTEKSE
jgi:hypothetical protein